MKTLSSETDSSKQTKIVLPILIYMYREVLDINRDII